MTRRPTPRPRHLIALSGAAGIRAFPPIDVPPGDLRAAFDTVRAEPAVMAARATARAPIERDAVRAATAALVARSVAAASRTSRGVG